MLSYFWGVDEEESKGHYENGQVQIETINTTGDTDIAGDSLENSFIECDFDDDQGEESYIYAVGRSYPSEDDGKSSIALKPLVFGTASMCIFAIIFVIMAVGAGKGMFLPSVNAPPNNSLLHRNSALYNYLVTAVVNGARTFDNPVSPESQALFWMETEDTLNLDPTDLQQQHRIDQRFALLTLWFQSEFEWLDQTGWLSEDECTWKGVVCGPLAPKTRRSLLSLEKESSNRRLGDEPSVVQTLSLESNNLQGELPADLSLLKHMTSLNLSGNKMHGFIPPAIASVSSLKELYLQNNNFSGTLNLDFSKLTNLIDINLVDNEFRGPIPPSLYSATSLARIQLDRNGFVGAISDEIGNLVNLYKFSIADNRLDGTIPSTLGKLKNLDELSLRRNALVGRIPIEISTLPELRYVDFSSNGLTGNTSAFSTIESLEFLILDNNTLSGELHLEPLRSLDVALLENNQFSGPLPRFAASSRLQVLRLGNNNFDSQPFPEYVYEMTSMVNLGLNNLKLTGSLADTIVMLSGLQVLDLENNSISGSIPSTLMEKSSLQELSLRSNQLTGSIPFEISFLTNLKKLDLSSNQLQSSIPVAIRRLTTLRQLSLEDNLLNGLIPTSLVSLSELETLNVANNALSGTIPNNFWDLSTLRTVHLENNFLSGRIPGLLENMKDIEVLNLASNAFRGRIPQSITALTNLKTLDLSFNFFGGPIPNDIGNLKNLRELLLGTNYDEADASFGLDGMIPPSIADIIQLERLELNRNRLTGSLPDQHSLLDSLEVYDVSGNSQLGGTIPWEFSKMSDLKKLSIYGTGIRGIVPDDLCEGNISIDVDCVGATTFSCRCCRCSS